MEVMISSIPSELQRLNQWVMWRYEQRGEGKPTKVPYQTNGKPASVNDSLTWSSFIEVISVSGYDGIGFVFSSSDPYVGIDLDNCISEWGIKPWGEALIKRFASYSEVSPSGEGVKIWVKGKYPGNETGKRQIYKDGMIEMYWERRYFTVTGNVVVPGRAITEQQSGIDGLYNTILNPPPPVTQRLIENTDTDYWVKRAIAYIEKCPDAVSGERGHDRTFHVACLCQRFGLDESDTKRVMQWYSNVKCRPQWTEREIDHKIKSAVNETTRDGSFGKYRREIDGPKVIINPPPKESSGLTKVLLDAIDGKRGNISFPWCAITSYSRALLPGTLTVICGLPGSTKSMMVSQACLYWLENNVSFSVFHLEEDRDYHLRRALAQLAGNANLTVDEWCAEHPKETIAANEKHKDTLDALSSKIWDAPASDIMLTDLIGWVRDRASEGSRVIIIDPVTAANSTDKCWQVDMNFVLSSKNIMREYGSSLIVVTHPRDGQKASKNNLDNHAGGRAYSRFSQCLIDIESLDKDENQERTVYKKGPCGTIRELMPVNRTINIKKARNAPGFAGLIGGWFDGATLLFEEHGVILKD